MYIKYFEVAVNNKYHVILHVAITLLIYLNIHTSFKKLYTATPV